MEMFKFGETKLNLPIHAYRFKAKLNPDKKAHVLIIGGVHGDEPEGVIAARGLLEAFRHNYSLDLNISLIPEFNPEGVLTNNRCNSNKVDLNRNLPTKDWTPIAAQERYNPGPTALSEKENQALVTFIKNNKLDLIISLHSWEPMLNTNGEIPEAVVISEHTGYKIEPYIGYPTPGSLGTYAGIENKIPTLTYEIQRDLQFDQVLKIHVPALIAGLKITEKIRNR
ncbi:MAG: M14 family zinc carboxypeptidase [Bdellovibrionota bacterium]